MTYILNTNVPIGQPVETESRSKLHCTLKIVNYKRNLINAKNQLTVQQPPFPN